MQRERMVYAYLAFLLIWFLMCFAFVKFVGMETWQLFGLGTVTGIFTTGFTLMWQFIWRKAAPTTPDKKVPPKEEPHA